MGFEETPGQDAEDERQATQKAEAATLTPLSEEFDWRVKFRTDAVARIKTWADEFGYAPAVLETFVRDNIDGAIEHMSNYINVDEVGQPIVDVRRLSPMSLPEWQRAWQQGMIYFSRMSGLNFDGLQARTGSGSGARRPTAADIRKGFDLDELTESANNLWGAYLMEDAPNARGLASQYVDMIVASGGEQALDFQTFVLGKIRETPRHDLLYRNKPEGTDELAYISPYRQAAQTVIGGGGTGGNTASAVATAGAALGGSASNFADRLARTPQNQQSKGFITGLEDRMRGVKNLLRG